ncbi:MAG TPA: prolyl oligopeptidase family serine peptidase [Steroidobacter sp.]
MITRMLGYLTLLGSFSFVGPAVAAPPIESYARLPQFRHIALSPSGKRLAWEEDGKEARQVTVLDVDSGKTLATIPLGDHLRDLHWGDETTVLLTVAATRSVEVDRLEHRPYEYRRLLKYDIESKHSCMLLMEGNRYYVTGATLLASRVTNAHTVAMSSWDWSLSAPEQVTESRLADRRRVWVYNTFSVDTRTCRGTLLIEGTPQTIDWVVDAAGQPVVRADWDVERRKYSVLAKDGSSWRTVFTRDNLMELGGLSTDGKSVMAIGRAEDGRTRLWSIPLQGSAAKTLIDDSAADVTRFVADGFSNVAIAVELDGQSEVRWLDDRARQRDETLKKTFKGATVHSVAHSQDFSRVVVEVASTTAAPTLYLIDFASGKADIIGEPYPELSKAPVSVTQPISYLTRDGATLAAHLTLPGTVEQKNLPTIVLSRDSDDQDTERYDWLVQFLVSRGYAVFQPQLRESTVPAMRNDIADGARFLISQGIADQRRLCVVGTGYGAHAALAGATLGPVGLYSCVVGINGVYQLSDYLAYIEEHFGEKHLRTQYWQERIGKPTDVQAVDNAIAKAARLTPMPVLLIHAEKDTATPLAQSEQFSRSLAGRPVQLVKLPDDDHHLSNASSRLALLKELETFLGRTLATPSP